MKFVIQCAGDKNSGGFWLNNEGRRILFVAHPEYARPESDVIFARPDDKADPNTSWRELLLSYNRNHYHDNPFGLFQAFALYKNSSYQNLVDKFGFQNVYVLSAGWGLVRSDFLIPTYDITFSGNAKKKFLWRRKNDYFNDFNMLSPNGTEEVIFLGGKSYLPLFHSLTKNGTYPKTIVYNSKDHPQYYGYLVKSYNRPDLRTNWHYSCANEIASGSFVIDD